MAANNLTKLVPNDWRYTVADLIVNNGNAVLYFFVGDHTDHPNTEIQPLIDSVRLTLHDAYRDMIMGKRLQPTDVCLMIRNIPYAYNKVFAMYDDTLNLKDLDFYAVVNAASWYHVFKCLDNNFDSPSTVEPNFADISGANSVFYQTSDGYVWKYIYTVDNSAVLKFGLPDSFPIVPNTTTTALAIPGAVDVIKIDEPGLFYNNYLTDSFGGQEVRIGGDPTLYEISNTISSTVNGFYTGCMLYLSSGIGAGQYTMITDYFCNSNGNYVVIDKNNIFGIPPLNGTAYQIYPSVAISGSGMETETAYARALVNAVASNSVYKIEILNRGEDYNEISAHVVANDVVGVTRPAILRPIYSPAGGHGANPASELECSKVEVSVTLSNNEQGTILTTNKFQQIGLIMNPTFANVEYHLSSVSGAFIPGETIIKIRQHPIISDATLDISLNAVTSNTAKFDQWFAPGEFVYLTAANNTLNQLGIVASVVNSSVMALTTTGFFSCTQISVLSVDALGELILNDMVSENTMSAYCMSGMVIPGDFIIGLTSGSIANIDSMARNHDAKQFATFIQLNKYEGQLDYGNFVENEIVHTSSASALLHSVINVGNNNIVFYTSNQIGQFILNDQVVGQKSGAIALVGNAYSPEIDYATGSIIYLENISAVTRQPDQNENFKIVFSF